VDRLQNTVDLRIIPYNKDARQDRVNSYRLEAYFMTGVQAAPAAVAGREADSGTAAAIKKFQAEGLHAEAREHFAEIVARHQRRASRIAYHYLRDAAEADEAVQDAFVKAYSHMATFREELPFEVWFTRILINGCLDRIKARGRRGRWIVPLVAAEGGEERNLLDRVASAGPTPEEALLATERRRRLSQALDRLPERQRTVFMLSQYAGHSSREVSAITGLNESTVRVHLFRAIRKLRRLLAPEFDAAAVSPGHRVAGSHRRAVP
jgi:RNA polymerase sigma-70 factor (ECF subfamily)